MICRQNFIAEAPGNLELDHITFGERNATPFGYDLRHKCMKVMEYTAKKK